MRINADHIKWVVLCTFIALVLFIFGVEPYFSAVRAREESIQILGDATDAQSLEEAVGHLGVVLQIRDRSWIAIRYCDSHGTPGWSRTVALDSNGQWYESTEHFCGKFKGYRHQRTQFMEYLKDPKLTNDDKKLLEETYSQDKELLAVEESTSLKEASARLANIGLTKCAELAQAKMGSR